MKTCFLEFENFISSNESKDILEALKEVLKKWEDADRQKRKTA